MRVWFIKYVFIFATVSVFSQQGNIEGKVLFENGLPVEGATIAIKDSKKYAISDKDGQYKIGNVPFGDKVIIVNSIEIIPKEVPFLHNNQNSLCDIKVSPNIIGLSAVAVNGKTIKKQIEDKGFAVNVIETKDFATRNLQTNELLNQTVGVRIRQNGGLGAEVNYNINGLSGNAVRIFIDGIPITSYGSSFDLNSIPPALIERIEIYKGVIPGYLADDALGGAINIVLKKEAKNNFNTSLSYGSFNTAQFNLNGRYRFNKNGFTIKTSGFINYSDNDYKVWGKNVYNILSNGQYEYVKVRRFNDAFRSTGATVELGFTDVNWADNFFIGFTTSDAYKEIQHGTFMNTPYKGRFLESDAKLIQITYNKKDILTEGLDFTFHGIAGERNRTINDTVKWNYNWYGEKSLDLNGQPILRPQGAQQGAPTLANIKRKTASFRSGLSYSFNKNNKILLNQLVSYVDREDDDQLKTIIERNFFGTRNLTKSITSLSYEWNAFEDQLKTSVFGKYYQQRIERMNPTVQNIDNVPTRVEDIVKNKQETTGYGVAISYTILPNVMLLASGEKAVRLPNENEVFGDAGDNIIENPNIKSEISENINLGFRLGTFEWKKHKIGITVNGFSRNIKDRIGLPIQTALNTNIQTLPFVNQGNAKSLGYDFELNYQYKKFSVIGNLSNFELTTKDAYGRKLILPNEPFLIANLSLQQSIDNIFQKKGILNLFYNISFVDQFNFLTTPYGNNAGIDFFEVPQQLIQDLGCSYIFPNKKFILSLDAKNIFNKQAFDNMAVQKPGRAFFFKINYLINNI